MNGAPPSPDRPPLRERLRVLRHVPAFLRLVAATRPSYAVAIVLFRVLQAFTPLAQLWIGKLVIDTVVASVQRGQADWPRLVRLIGLELGITLGTQVLSRVSSLVESLLGDLFTNRLSVRLMEHAATLDLEHFEDPKFYDHMERARRHAGGRIGLVMMLLNLGESALTLVSLLGALIAFSPWLLLLLLLAVLPGFLSETHFAGEAYRLFFRWTPERRELDYLLGAATANATAKEVKLFSLSRFFTGRYARLADRLYLANRALAVRRLSLGALLAALSTLVYYAAYGFMVWRTVRGDITLGSLTFLSGSFMRCRELSSGVLLGSAGIYEQALFLRDLFAFLDMRPRVSSPKDARPVPRPLARGFVFEGVGFRYPGSERWALRDVSFTLAPGSRLALVGENGAGKTTLVKLLARLYDPSEGRILLDGVDLREYSIEELRRDVGVIFQDFVRYDLIARENIAVGHVDSLDDLPRIERAARQSLAHEVIAKLPRAYEHMLGRRFEGGANLSDGEWQKVALGRAYVRSAQVLILDEPTASLDPRAEYEVFQRFAELTRDRIAVLISHRFSTVRMADRILVLEAGAVIEDGSHEALLARAGRYAELFGMQAAGYR